MLKPFLYAVSETRHGLLQDGSSSFLGKARNALVDGQDEIIPSKGKATLAGLENKRHAQLMIHDQDSQGMRIGYGDSFDKLVEDCLGGVGIIAQVVFRQQSEAKGEACFVEGDEAVSLVRTVSTWRVA